MTNWDLYPRSPLGPVEVCPHGTVRVAYSGTVLCLRCEYGDDATFSMCRTCKRLTWHVRRKCWGHVPAPTPIRPKGPRDEAA